METQRRDENADAGPFAAVLATGGPVLGLGLLAIAFGDRYGLWDLMGIAAIAAVGLWFLIYPGSTVVAWIRSRRGIPVGSWSAHRDVAAGVMGGALIAVMILLIVSAVSGTMPPSQ
jgi:hypothetical protein